MTTSMSNVEIDEVKNYLCDIGRPTGLCFKQNRAYNLDPDMMDRLAEIVLEQAAEIERLRTALKNWETDDQFERDYGIPEKIREQAGEIERLKTELAERRRRMEVMRSYMADYPTRGLSHFDNFIEMNENSSGWWNAEGRAK